MRVCNSFGENTVLHGFRMQGGMKEMTSNKYKKTWMWFSLVVFLLNLDFRRRRLVDDTERLARRKLEIGGEEEKT